MGLDRFDKNEILKSAFFLEPVIKDGSYSSLFIGVPPAESKSQDWFLSHGIPSCQAEGAPTLPCE
jgi:hypothetical protein